MHSKKFISVDKTIIRYLKLIKNTKLNLLRTHYVEDVSLGTRLWTKLTKIFKVWVMIHVTNPELKWVLNKS